MNRTLKDKSTLKKIVSMDVERLLEIENFNRIHTVICRIK